VHLYRTAAEIDNTILHIGSHDLALDLMAQFLTERAPGLRLSSANVGSLGGLIALARGECHFAGSHLIDPATGKFNHASVRRYLPDTPVQLITLVEREQGLLVAPGNPLRIKTLADLVRKDVRYVNRQRGAGTRVLLDYELGKLGIAAVDISGYPHEEYTHLGVAVAISSGIADCGLGIHAAASALKLDFVPLTRERYDLVVPEASVEGALLQPLLALLTDAHFRAAVSARPGYSVELMGERRAGLL
jgi:putative molybdopterin biosynthesis protein